MTTVLIDSFNRTGANLGTNPSGRWSLTSPGGGLVNDWTLDGQKITNAATMTAASRCLCRFYQTDPGTNNVEVSIRFKRATTAVTYFGIHARSNRSTLTDHARIAFVFNGGQYQLWSYTGLTGGGVLTAPTGPSINDTNWHTFKLRVETTGTTMSLQTWVDGQAIHNIAGLAPVNAGSAYRAAGFEVETPVGFMAATDLLYFDDFTLANLTAAITETEPSLTAETNYPEDTPLASEGAGVGALPINPDFGEVMEEEWPCVETFLEAPHEVTYPRTTRTRKRWTCVHRAVDSTDAQTIKDFLDAKTGASDAFAFTAFDGTTYNVHYLDGSFTFELMAYAVYGKASYVLEEIIL